MPRPGSDPRPVIVNTADVPEQVRPAGVCSPIRPHRVRSVATGAAHAPARSRLPRLPFVRCPLVPKTRPNPAPQRPHARRRYRRPHRRRSEPEGNVTRRPGRPRQTGRGRNVRRTGRVPGDRHQGQGRATRSARVGRGGDHAPQRRGRFLDRRGHRADRPRHTRSIPGVGPFSHPRSPVCGGGLVATQGYLGRAGRKYTQYH